VIRAIVFDFDGVILDTEAPIFRAWNEEFEAHGCPLLTVEEWSAEIGTVQGLDLLALLRERATVEVDADAVAARRRARRDELLAQEALLEGVETWLDDAREAGIALAIASSSEAGWVEPHLQRLGVRHRFAHLACYRPGGRAKPAPDLYLAACAALGVAPAEALAIEDSPNGIAAAKAAGLVCVAVPHGLTESLDLSSADVVVPSLASVSLGEIVARFG
jgi:HAD superfamily hydrolase (TIGR01509 family)